jgi:hypothetical protein
MVKEYEKMLSIFSHQGNVNQNDIEIASYPSQNDNHQENKQQQMLEKIWDTTLLVGL